MSKATATAATADPEIHKLRLSALVIDPALSGRSEKEIKQNAEALAPSIAAAGGWEPSQPGQVFMRKVGKEKDAKPHLLAGFTRAAATKIAGFNDGYFVIVPDDAQSIRLSAIRTNLGRGISQFEQGRIFDGMMEGSDPAKLAVGEEALKPMKQADVAKACGVSHTHVGKCVAIFKSPKEIGVLIEEDKVSPNVVFAAGKIAKGDAALHMKIVSAAIQNATQNGDGKATEKHFDAIKADFQAPLKAVSGNGAKKKSEETEIKEAHEETPDETGNRVATETGAQTESVLNLGTTEPGPKKQSTQDKKSERTNLIAVITKCDQGEEDNDRDGLQLSMSDDDIETLADAILKAGFHQSSPI